MGAFDWLPFQEFAYLSRYNALCIVYICFGACFYGYDSGMQNLSYRLHYVLLKQINKASRRLSLLMRAS